MTFLAPSDDSFSAHYPSGEAFIWYTNWRGEESLRRIQPLSIRFGTTPWHPEPGWLLHALDLDKGVPRDFAVKDISLWQEIRKKSAQVSETTG